MNEEQKKEVAVFRYGIIADFVGATRLDRGNQVRPQVANTLFRPHPIESINDPALDPVL